MSTEAIIPALMLFTLIAALAIAVALLVRFMRKPENRHPLAGKQERNIAEVIDRVDAEAAASDDAAAAGSLHQTDTQAGVTTRH